MGKQPSLSDVVKQEAQKVNETEAQPVEATVVDSNEVSELKAIENSSISDVTETSTRRKSPTKADLEVKITELTDRITELQSTLETFQNNERTLQEKVLGLQSEIEEKGTFIAQLQEDIKRNDLTDELEKAQKTALQLSEKNSELLEELETLKKENQELKEKQKQQSKPGLKKTNLPQIHQRPEHVENQPQTSSNDFSQSTWLL
ncbi:MAG: hypothetical protein AAFO04_25170 [Cyanobacteria bacterium J06592_8]